MKGLTIVHKKIEGERNKRVIVTSDTLARNPILDQPISGARISSKYIPESRIEINEWFKKIF
tara:strand:+ start:1538 stop:1723 length:186 start_codon:yes stop_codon:yes gene_type:complete